MKADFVVVGGGITGVCAAYHLAKRGADVLLLERDEIGPEAPISSSGEHAKAFRTIYGRDRKMTRLCTQSFAFWRQLEEETGEALFVPCGMLVFGAQGAGALAHWPHPEAASFALDSAATLSEEGLPHELLSQAELLERFPQLAPNDTYDHGILDHTAGFLRARTAVRAIGALAERAGATLWEHANVEEVVRDGEDVVRLVTSRGDVEPRRAVVFAAGYMNSTLASELRRKTRVTRQRLLFLAPRDPAAYAPNVFPVVVDVNVRRYVFPVHGPGITKICDDDNSCADRIVEPGGPLDNDADGFRADAMAFLRAHVPGLLDSTEVDHRVCHYTNTVSEQYLVYRRGNSVVLSACSGHGFKNAPMTALAAATLADPESGPPSYSERDFAYEAAGLF